MVAEITENLELTKPAGNEYAEIDVLNENFNKIDRAVGDLMKGGGTEEIKDAIGESDSTDTDTLMGKSNEILEKLERQGEQLETIQNADTHALITPSDKVIKTLISEEKGIYREYPYKKTLLVGNVVGRTKVTASLKGINTSYKISLKIYRNDILIETKQVGNSEEFETVTVEINMKKNDVLRFEVAQSANNDTSKGYINLLTISGTTDIFHDEVFLDVFEEPAVAAKVESLTRSEQTAAAVEYLAAMAEGV